jgi:hypothetical protein
MKVAGIVNLVASACWLLPAFIGKLSDRPGPHSVQWVWVSFSVVNLVLAISNFHSLRGR